MSYFKIIGLLVPKKKNFKGFGHLTKIFNFIKFMFPLPKEALQNFCFDSKAVSEKIFNNNGYLHVYNPGAGTEGQNVFENKKIFCKFGHLLQVFPLKWLCNTFSLSIA